MSRDGIDLVALPLDEVLSKRKALRRKLSAREGLRPIRIAVLGGSTTNEVVDLLGALAPAKRLHPHVLSERLRTLLRRTCPRPGAADRLPTRHRVHPHILPEHRGLRSLQASEVELNEHVQQELRRFQRIWDSLEQRLGCLIIQNNAEFPPYQILGNLDVTQPGGHTRFVMELNLAFARTAAGTPKLLIQDVCSLSARIGLDRWFDWERYFSYKVLTTAEASMAIAVSLSATIRGIYGKARKVLVLDLDNTLWGGVIGDDGVDKIAIGRETPLAEAYTAFQEYCLSLRDRGVLLAVCSKNNEETARQGFEHPDSVLKLEHVSCFKANWNPKA